MLLCISSTETNHKTSDHDMFPFIGGEAYCGQWWRVLREIIIIARVSGRVVVVVVVVRELFSLVTSAICVRVRGYEDCLPHDSSFSSTAVFSPQ